MDSKFKEITLADNYSLLNERKSEKTAVKKT